MAESPRKADAETGGVRSGTKGRADVVGGGRRLVRTAAGGRVAWAVVRALTPQASLVGWAVPGRHHARPCTRGVPVGQNKRGDLGRIPDTGRPYLRRNRASRNDNRRGHAGCS